MNGRAPGFWNHRGVLSAALLPLAALYSLATRLRWRFSSPRDCGLPVICVGNLTSGGAGKTPIVLDLLQRLHGMGITAFALTRGYGGRERGPILVDPQTHGWRDVGDEALLLAHAAPTVVAADRVAGAAFAKAQGAELLVMDDGFQNPALKKDLSLLVIDRAQGLGNGRVLPAGPLREPPEAAFSRAGALILAGSGAALDEAALPPGIPRLEGELRLLADPAAWRGRRVVAFAGIGYPRKFFEALRSLGAEVASAAAFPDHHPYRTSELVLILKKAAALDALAVTTEKDAQRIDPDLRERFTVLKAAFAWRNEERLATLLRGVLPKS
jgi:tetraacyldisaccharide 4'-kinase